MLSPRGLDRRWHIYVSKRVRHGDRAHFVLLRILSVLPKQRHDIVEILQTHLTHHSMKRHTTLTLLDVSRIWRLLAPSRIVPQKDTDQEHSRSSWNALDTRYAWMQDIYGNAMRAICEKHALQFATALAEIEIPARSFAIKGAVNRRLTLMLPRDLYQALDRDTVGLSRMFEQSD